MTQDERREYLIHYLLKEEMKFVRQSIPTDKQGQEPGHRQRQESSMAVKGLRTILQNL